MSPRSRRHTAIALGAAVVVFGAVVMANLPTPRGAIILSNLAQCLAPAAAAVGCFLASRRAEVKNHSRAWLFLGISATCWCIGQIIWTYYEVSQTAAPFPSAADAGYLLAIPFAFTGVWTLATRSTTSAHVVAAVDGLIMAGSLLAISWPLVLGPSWQAGGDSPLTFALSLAYPIGALVVGSSVLMVIMRAGRQRTEVPLSLIGTFIGSSAKAGPWTTTRGS